MADNEHTAFIPQSYPGVYTHTDRGYCSYGYKDGLGLEELILSNQIGGGQRDILGAIHDSSVNIMQSVEHQGASQTLLNTLALRVPDDKSIAPAVGLNSATVTVSAALTYAVIIRPDRVRENDGTA